jgi:hypothetical protein
MTLQLCILQHEPESGLRAFADALGGQLLERWLYLVSGVPALSSTLEAAV